MSTEEQDDRTSGGVPNTFGNALAWRWVPAMPEYLRSRRGFLTLLYVLRTLANADGQLRFQRDRKPIRIQDIAAAAAVSEKDCRRYLDAAIKAGVVVINGERKRGKPTLYVIVTPPQPCWEAAAAHLLGTARKSGRAPAPWSSETRPEPGEAEESSGHRDLNQFGSPRPELTEGTETEVRVTATRWSSGHRDPNGSGHRDPNNPGSTQGSTHDGAEVGFQPQVVGRSEDPQEPHEDPPDTELRRCTECRQPIAPDPRRPGRTIHTACARRAADDHERHSA